MHGASMKINFVILKKLLKSFTIWNLFIVMFKLHIKTRCFGDEIVPLSYVPSGAQMRGGGLEV